MMEVGGTGRAGARLSFHWRERDVNEVFELLMHGATTIPEQGRG
jgi:hypothetical protein